MMRPTTLLAAALGGLLLASAPVAAQSSMPLPPSVADPLPKTTSEPARGARKTSPARNKAAGQRDAAPANPSFNTRNLSDRIDLRSSRDSLQLEDDPRVRPTMEGGRAGMGMRF